MRKSSVLKLFVFAPLLSILLAAPPAGGRETGAEEPALWKDPAQPLELRVRDLVGRMTLEEKARQVCNVAPAIRRLGLPAYDYWNEALHGIGRHGLATVFPQAIGMAASFDPALLHTVADAIATEGRAKNREYTGKPTTATAPIIAGCHFGRPTSTFFATLAGAGARRLMARILF